MPTVEEIKAQRLAYEEKHYTKLIDCPAHPGAHWAILYEWGHQFGGSWECPAGAEDSCDHDTEREGIDWETETVEVDDSHPDRSDGYSYEVYVCAGPEGCGVSIDFDVANPAEDAHDAMVDAQIDEIRERDL